jgi:hypothetical protein
METNAWKYRDAARTLREGRTITDGQAKTLIEGEEKIGFDVFREEDVAAYLEVAGKGETPYTSMMADRILASLSMEKSDTAHRRAETLAYNASKIASARGTIEKYDRMVEQGYMPIHDITREHHGRKALLAGTITHDWLTTRKDDEPVKLVCNDDRIGYQRPRMRTRFFRAPVDADLFVKLA